MKVVKIGDIAELVSKGTTPTSIGLSFTGIGIPFLRGEDILGSAVNFSSVKMFIDGDSHEKLNRSALQFGDVLITIAGTIGRIGYIDSENITANCNQAVAFVRTPLDRVNPFWLCLLLSSPKYQKKFEHFVVGGAIPNVSLQQIRSIEIPDIQLENQHRITAQLKSQLAEVEKARNAAVVQVADAEALAVAYSGEVFSKKNMECWRSVSLGDAGEVVSGITLGRKAGDDRLREVPYLRVANVKDGHLDLTEIKTVEATETEIEKWRLRVGDILLTEGGDPDKLGRGTFWSGELTECIHQNHIFRVRFPADRYLPEFVSAQIGSPYGKAYFLAHAKKTTGIATINQKVLKAFPLFSPPIEKQKEVMTCLSEKLKETQKLISGYRKRLEEIDILPNRLLSRAFEMN